MDPFQVSSANSIMVKQPQNALMVVDNRQLQVWNGPPSFQNLQQEGAIMELTADSGTLESPPSSASASPSAAPQEPKKKRVVKKRKATHTIRKEQKAALEKEIEELQAKLENIKFRALVQQGEVSRSYHDKTVENAVLKVSIQDQHLVMAQVRALLSGQMQHQMSGVRPMETRICLSADREERRRVLHALRGAKLREAKRFLCARSSGIKPNTPYFQEERYESADGGYCIARFEITPLYGVKGGVRAVFDAVLQAAFNVEIIISETSGNITVREDDDMNDESVSQMRLVSQTNRGVLVENNLVHFTEYAHGESGKGCYAVTSTDFVDEDELYPYRPLERVRRDMTAAMLVSYLDSPKKGDKKEDEPVVILMRWASHVVTREVDQSDISDNVQEPVKKKRAYKKRKATNTVRKEEKLALQVEIAALQAKLKNLELQTLVQRGEEDTVLHNTVAHNAMLRDFVQEQHLAMAHAQGMLLGCALRHSYQIGKRDSRH
ncbi:hypothetical protein F443_18413 [Phytophthora nicotianae P1569]|uniref:Uncharacterized protein n=1 Tax=Phytophthora nicotianae P1569 TaxID=1317065 RepID=V9E7Z0_PHYNI|nr:hypothetical protein F443_18413 [Phytophthora nicotianae P1569]